MTTATARQNCRSCPIAVLLMNSGQPTTDISGRCHVGRWSGLAKLCAIARRSLPGVSRVVMTRLNQAVLRASCGVLRAVRPSWTGQWKSRLVLMPCGGKHPQRRAFVLLLHDSRFCSSVNRRRSSRPSVPCGVKRYHQQRA